MKYKTILFVALAILSGVGVSMIVNPIPRTQADEGIVTADCGQVQPVELGIHFTVLPNPDSQIAPQSTGGPISSGQAVAIASQKAFVRNQLPAPLVKTQYVSYSNDIRGVGAVADDETSADEGLVTQSVNAWVVTFCGVVTYPSLRRLPNDQQPETIPVRNEWNVVINAQTGALIEEYSTR